MKVEYAVPLLVISKVENINQNSNYKSDMYSLHHTYRPKRRILVQNTVWTKLAELKHLVLVYCLILSRKRKKEQCSVTDTVLQLALVMLSVTLSTSLFLLKFKMQRKKLQNSKHGLVICMSQNRLVDGIIEKIGLWQSCFSHTFFASYFFYAEELSHFYSLKEKSHANHNPFTQVDTVSGWRRHSLGMFVCADPLCTLLSKIKGMREIKAAQIPPSGALQGLNSSLVVLVQPVHKSNRFLLWHWTKLSGNAGRLWILPS